MEGRTVMVIAHRASTLRRADRIYVLDEGRITDAGSHRELLSHAGAYQAMHGRQHA
jgi:ABC-type multidrug transport system fused ATPase/permease subunit